MRLQKNIEESMTLYSKLQSKNFRSLSLQAQKVDENQASASEIKMVEQKIKKAKQRATLRKFSISKK